MEDLRPKVIQRIVEHRQTTSLEIAGVLNQPVGLVNQILNELSKEGWFKLAEGTGEERQLLDLNPDLENLLPAKDLGEKEEVKELDDLELPDSVKNMTKALYPEI